MRLSQTELKPNQQAWITLMGNMQACEAILETYNTIDGMMDEIGLQFCDLDDAGVSIDEHCAASVAFSNTMSSLRQEVDSYLVQLRFEQARRRSQRGLSYAGFDTSDSATPAVAL